MIRIQLGERRRQLLRETLDTGDPDRRVHEVLAVTDRQIIMPVRHAESMARWLGACHAYYGLGYPTGLVEMRATLERNLIELSTHPALWGHGMIGQSRTIPISCWQILGAAYPHQMYTVEPVGIEGFLVPTKEEGGGIYYTAWTFSPGHHGLPRSVQTMFRPSFATAGRIDIDPATQDAAAAKVRAAILDGVGAQDWPPSPLEEDGGDLPSSP